MSAIPQGTPVQSTALEIREESENNAPLPSSSRRVCTAVTGLICTLGALGSFTLAAIYAADGDPNDNTNAIISLVAGVAASVGITGSCLYLYKLRHRL